MNSSIAIMLLPALIGHCVFWVCMWNHINGSSLRRRWIRRLSRTCFLACGLLPFVTGLSLYFGTPAVHFGAAVYLAFCFTVTVVTLPWEYIRRRRAWQDNGLLSQTERVRKLEAERRESLSQASGVRRWLLGTSLNQAFEIEVTEKELRLPRLERELDGLTIAHISDLHFTGQISRSWFEAAIDLVNEMDADIVAITGDLVDNPECNSWLASTVGKLRAPHGCYFILGNHDKKQDTFELRDILTNLGLIDLAGRFQHIAINGNDVFLAGDEAPWGPAMPNNHELPARELLPQTRILLAHSPDSIEEARAADFDLMLSGHTHGGQFCVPMFGPFVCPMQRPLELSTGAIYRSPTLLHVSRGLSAELPLRINCRPEVTRLVLRAANAEAEALEHSDATDSVTTRPSERTAEPRNVPLVLS